MGFKAYAAKRLLQAVPSVITVVMVSFIIVRLVPGDPAQMMAGEAATVQNVAKIRQSLGLDKPIYEQLIIYFQRLAQGDLGYSYVQLKPVSYLILERLPNTLLLVSLALTLGIAVGITTGVIAASKPYSKLDNILTIFALTSYAAPTFWVAQMGLLLFAVFIPIFPAGGYSSVRLSLTGWPRIVDILWHLVLPVMTLWVVYMAEQYRFTRASMLEVLSQDYITTARSKGVNQRSVLFTHALRNALLPVVTLTGLRFGSVFTGAVLDEVVYAWPGVGRLMYEAVFQRDYPVVLGCFIFTSVLVIVGAFLTDLVYGLIDPRIRYK